MSQVFQTQIGGKFAALNLIDREIDTNANIINVGLLQLKMYWEDKEKIQIWIMNEGVRHPDDEARRSTNIAQRGQEEDEITKITG